MISKVRYELEDDIDLVEVMFHQISILLMVPRYGPNISTGILAGEVMLRLVRLSISLPK